MRIVSLRAARRLAVVAQGLDATGEGLRRGDAMVPIGAPDALGGVVGRIADTVHALGYVQVDPIAVVERSPLLVLRSRLGSFEREALDQAIFGNRLLFEYWAHAAAVVPVADYEIHRLRMRRYAREDHMGHERVHEWIVANEPLRDAILSRLAEEGPLGSRAFSSVDSVRWQSSGWTGGRDVDRMLTFLWVQGLVVISGRSGTGRLYDLAERWLPPWTPRAELDDEEIVTRAVVRSLRSLGIATDRQIMQNYTAGYYPGYERVLEMLAKAGDVEQVQVVDAAGDPLRGRWFVHRLDLGLLQRMQEGEFAGRAVLLSPFDNLLINRARAAQLFGFDFKMEIYVPKHLRRYGYYVLPLLDGETLVARIDARTDRRRGVLRIEAVHPEASAPAGVRRLQAYLREAHELARFCGCAEVEMGTDALPESAPAAWSRVFG